MAGSRYEYILSLRDKMSGTLKKVGATGQQTYSKLQTQQETLNKSVSSFKNILGAIGLSSGVFAVVSMMQKGTEKIHELHQAEAQIKAGLISTGGAAGLVFEDMERSAKKFSSEMLFGRGEIMRMQSILLTFPKVTKKSFDPAQQAILDMATRMQIDLPRAAVMVGKALQDPVTGVMMMRRVGVNFTREQVEGFRKMVESGNLYGAQMSILKELQTEFGGSAKAAFDADPLAKYNKAIGKIQMMFGEFAVGIQKTLSPAFQFIANHIQTIKDIGSALLWVVGPMAIYKSVLIGIATWTKLVAWFNGLSTAAIILNTLATEGLAGAWVAVKLAMDGAGIGLIITGIIALGAAMVWAFKKVGWFRGAVLAAWEAIKGFGVTVFNFYKDTIGGLIKGLGKLGEAFMMLFRGDFKGAWQAAKEGVMDIISVKAYSNVIKNAKQAGKNMGAAYQKGVAEVGRSKKAASGKGAGLGSKIYTPDAFGADGGAGAGDLAGSTGKEIAAGGSRPTNITINLRNLVETLSITPASMKEGTQELERMVREALLRTLNSANATANG